MAEREAKETHIMRKTTHAFTGLKTEGTTWEELLGASRSGEGPLLTASKETRTSLLQFQGTEFC